MNTTNLETQISADPDVPLVRIVREFDAPPEKVFRAHVEPDLAARWLGPRGYEMEVERWDATTGGGYRYVHRDGDEEYWFHGSFHDVLADDLTIVQTFSWEGMPESVSLERLTLTALPDGRSRLASTSLMDSFDARDAMMASGMEVGITEGYQQLDELLAG